MGQLAGRNKKVTLLLDQNSFESRLLYHTLQEAGYETYAIMMDDDGFLPEGITSVYGSYLGDFSREKTLLQRPRYFNEIDRPDYWEITASNLGGKVTSLGHERGRIFYTEPKERRLVKVVDWLDEEGNVRSCDSYNQYGALFARTICNAKGQRATKTYYDASGREKIVENFVTGDIILNEDNKTCIFGSKTEFIADFLRRNHLDEGRIFYNSLSTPFFVSESVGGKCRDDVLFWQEGPRDDVPGNMQLILSGRSSRTGGIVVQKAGAYEKLIQLAGRNRLLQKMGYIYPFERENGGSNRILIATNSDQIEQLDTLISGLPEAQFHIAALTEMSPKLLACDDYDNVTLYPGASRDTLGELFQTCDFLLDINHGNEIVDATRRGFLNNQLVYAFSETAHNRDYVAPEQLYQVPEVSRMIRDIKNVLADKRKRAECLERQRGAALAQTRKNFAIDKV